MSARAMRSRRTPRLALAAGLCAAGVAHPLRAQRVRVTVVEAATRAPALGVVVSLTDPANHRVVSGLTDAQGSVVLAPPAAGRFAVRAERVGADPWTSGAPVPLTPARSDTLAVSAALTARTTRLHATVLRADRRCDRLGEADGSAASVWQAASAALAATALSEREGRVRTRLRLYERELTAGGRVEAERLTGQGLGTGRPFTTRTPAQLGGDGYVRPAGAGAEYFGPDAAALLSSEFAATHCVRLVRGAGAEAGLVGLAFDVVPGRTQPDIAGTLWVDEATAALRHVAYRYVQVPSPEAHLDVPATAVATGRVEFAPGAGGAWLVRRWWIRLPKLTRPPLGPRLGTGPGGGGVATHRSTYLVTGYMERGGEAEPVDALTSPSPLPSPLPSRVADGVAMVDDSAGVRAVRAHACAAQRQAADRRVDSLLAVPAGRWRWSGPQPDAGTSGSAAPGTVAAVDARALRRAQVIVQVAVDTSGQPEMATFRTLRAPNADVAELARRTIVGLQLPVAEPTPGCRVRSVGTLPMQFGVP